MKSTTDYSIFKKMHGNRMLKVVHIQALVDAIKKNNLLKARPILVNEHLEVIDGQHRLEAAKLLEVPIFYEIIDGLNIGDVAMINSNQRNWKLDYFLELYCNSVNDENYKKLREWMVQNDFSLNQALVFFIDESNISKFRQSFKNGEFVFDVKIASIAQKYKVFVNKAETYSKGIQRPWKQQGFIRAFIMFLSNQEIDEKRLWDQIDKYPFLLNARPTKQLMLEMLYDLYNYRRHIKVEN